jgi:hypothetical protein
MLQAIQTKHNGFLFRSRLEARWALFFDEMGIKYEYEPEGFKTKCGYYLPDFRVMSRYGYPIWYEIKPRGFSSCDRFDSFSQSGIVAQMLCGDPYNVLFDDKSCVLCPRCLSLLNCNFRNFDTLDEMITCDENKIFSFYCYSCDKDTPGGGGHALEVSTYSPFFITPYKGDLELASPYFGLYYHAIHQACVKARSARF